MKIKKIISCILISQLILPTQVFAFKVPPASDRWNKSGGSYATGLTNQTINEVIENALPKLAAEGVVSGDAQIVSTNQGRVLLIDQGTTRVLLDWDSFNIGSNNKVNFVQPDKNSVALNRIYDTAPSKIFGNLNANGSVWLVNPNGILFGEGSQVDVRGLIASALQINGLEMNEIIEPSDRRLTPEQEREFQQDNLFDAINSGEPFLTDARENIEGTSDIPSIVVAEGATIISNNAPALLAAPEVINEGLIYSDSGQVVLAGSKKDVFLAVANNGGEGDKDLRGYLVEVSSGFETLEVSVDEAVRQLNGDGTPAFDGDGNPIYRIQTVTKLESGIPRGTKTQKTYNEPVRQLDANGQPTDIAVLAPLEDGQVAADREPLLQDRTVSFEPEGGGVVNAGEITANLGNITLVASDILQAGKLKSSTAVDVNGSIRIVARDGVYDDGLIERNSSVIDVKGVRDHLYDVDNVSKEFPANFAIGENQGRVTFSSTSDIQITIDNNPDKTRAEEYYALGLTKLPPDITEEEYLEQIDAIPESAADDSLEQLSSKINIEGRIVSMEDGSSIVAPSADLTIRSKGSITTDLEDVPSLDIDKEALVYIGQDAVIDVSGTTDTVLDVDRNTLTFFVTSNEVKDVPDQKGGELLRKTVTVDVRKGTSLIDWESGLAQVQKTAGERSSAGGTVEITTTGTVVIDDNATIDVSGGRVNYEDGFIETSRVLSNGKIVDISQANPEATINDVFQAPTGNVVDPDWGKRDSFRQIAGVNSRYYRESYFEGQDAGSIEITSPIINLAEDVNLLAKTELGTYQRGPDPISGSPASGLVLLDRNTNSFANSTAYIYSDLFEIDEEITEEDLLLRQSVIEESGAGNFVVENRGDINLVESESTLTLNDGNGIQLLSAGGDINIAGNIRAVGGDVELVQQSEFGNLIVSGVIDTSGNWINDNPLVNPALEGSPVVDAGDVDIFAAGSLAIDEQASIIANAGLWLNDQDQFILGKAGNITLDVDIETLREQDIQGTFTALDNTSGGTLTITAQNITIGGDVDTSLNKDMVVSNDFFDDVQVGAFNFVAQDGQLVVTSEADIDLAHNQLLLPTDRAVRSEESAQDATAVYDNVLLTDYFRSPGSLTLSAESGITTDVNTNIVTVEDGARITGPAHSSLEIDSTNRIFFDGSFQSAGGRAEFVVDGGNADQSYILVGNNAELDVSAALLTDVTTNDGLSSPTRVVEAGSISLEAISGALVVARDATLRLAGDVFSRVEIIFNDETGRNEAQDIRLAADAGDFTAVAEKGLFVAAEIDFGDAAAEGFEGGSITTRLSRQDSLSIGDLQSNPYGPADFILGGDSLLDLLAGFQFGDSLPYIGDDLTDLGDTSAVPSNVTSLEGKGVLAQANLNNPNVQEFIIDVDNAPISSADLSNSQLPVVLDQYLAKITVQDDITVSAQSALVLDTPSLDLNGSDLTVESAFVQLGEQSSTNRPQEQTSIELNEGDGRLGIFSEFIEFVGSLTVSGANTLNLAADEAISARVTFDNAGTAPVITQSSLDVAGTLTLDTPLLYASTLADFAFNVYGVDPDNLADPDLLVKGVNSQFNLVSSSVPGESPLAFGGKIEINAGDIAIDGNISSPFGQLTLNAQDSISLGENASLAVNAQGSLPFGRVVNGEFIWTYDLATGKDSLIWQPGQDNSTIDARKVIALNADNITAESGSQINLAGGGNVYSREFIAGLGGSNDILENQSVRELFAIVPTRNSGFTAYDALEFRGADLKAGTTFEVSGSEVIADGSYTVLPANYALLPGAYLVSPAGTEITREGYQTITPNGSELVSGRMGRAGSAADNNWTTFRVESNENLANRVQYNVFDADSYASFVEANVAGSRPADNGRLALTAGSLIDFEGEVLGSVDSVVGTSLDVSSTSSKIVITDNLGQQINDALIISPELFTVTGADSILVGATRGSQEVGSDFSADVDEITIDNASIDAPELVLTAKNSINLINNTELSSSAESTSGSLWSPTGSGATLLVSSSNDSRIDFTSIESIDGGVVIDDTSSVQASGTFSAIFDSDSSSGFDNVELDNANLQLGSESLSLGSNSVITDLLLSSAQSIELFAQEAITFASDIALDTQRLSLTSKLIELAGGVAVDINAEETVEINGLIANEQQESLINNDASSLFIDTQQLTIANLQQQGLNKDNQPSAKLSIAAENVTLTAEDRISYQGEVDLQIATSASTGRDSSVSLVTPLITSDAISQNSTTVAGTLGLSRPVGSEANNFVANVGGSQTRFIADAITVDTTIRNRSGLVSFSSTDGDIDVFEAALIDVGSFEVNYPDRIVKAATGGVVIDSAANVSIDSPSSFDFGDDLVESGFLSIKSKGQLSLSNSLDPQIGRWATEGDGGLDLFIESDSLSGSDPMAVFELLNANGFDGDVELVITGDDENILVDEGVQLTAENLVIAAVDGIVNMLGNINITDATKDVVLFGGATSLTEGEASVLIADTASLTINSASKPVNLSLQAPNGAVDVDAGAAIAIDGGLDIVQSADLTAFDDDVLVDVSNDSISGNTSLYLYDSQTLSAAGGIASITQTTLENLLSTVMGAVNALVGGNGESEFINTTNGVEVKPYLDILANETIEVSSELDFVEQRTDEGLAGKFRLRSGSDITISNAISDGVVAKDVLPGFVELDALLIEGKSWDMDFIAGADTSVDYGYYDFLKNNSITIANKGSASNFVRTGDGDLSFRAAGDLQVLGQNSYIASLGQTTYADVEDSLFKLSFNSVDIFPTFGDDEFSSIWLAFNNFSGFSDNTGDITIDVAGSLIADSDFQNAGDFMVRFASDDFSFNDVISPDGRFAYDLSGLRSVFMTINQIKGGIHNVGGGDINVKAGRSIDNVGFTTPGQLLKAVGDEQIDITNGGNINVMAMSSVSGASFQNDGGSIAVRSMGAIKGKGAVFGNSLFIGSFSDISAIAGYDLVLDGVLNSFAAPVSNQQFTNPLFQNGQNAYIYATEFFFYGYEESSISLTSIGGEFVFRDYLSGTDHLQDYFGGQASNQYIFNKNPLNGKTLNSNAMGLLSFFPAKTTLQALSGDMTFENPVSLFPSAQSELTIETAGNLSFENVYGNKIEFDQDQAFIYLADFGADVVKSIASNFAETAIELEVLISTLYASPFNADDPVQAHSINLLDRSGIKHSIYVGESIGGENQPLISLVGPADIYAGEDIFNTSISLQHDSADDISTIAAKNIIFPIKFKGTSTVIDDTSDTDFIKIAGSGDLLVLARENIELGASAGILSISNQENPALTIDGANLSVYAGFSNDGDLASLIGDGITENDLAFFETLTLNGESLDQADLETLSFGEILLALLNPDSSIDNEDGQSLSTDPSDTLLRFTTQRNFENTDENLNPDDEQSNYRDFIVAQIARAKGVSFSTYTENGEGKKLTAEGALQAIEDWSALDPIVAAQIAVSSVQGLLAENPSLAVANSDKLFTGGTLGEIAFADDAERADVFNKYWSVAGGLSTLEYLLSTSRRDEFFSANNFDAESIIALPVNELVTAGVRTFESYDANRQLLVANQVLNSQLQQSSIEGLNSGNSLFNFERGFVALKRFFGSDFDLALNGIAEKVESITSGTDESLSELSLGTIDGQDINSFDQIIDIWQNDSGESFEASGEYDPLGFIDMVFSSIRSLTGDINLYVPGGSVDVGVAEALLKDLRLKTEEVNGELQVKSDEVGLIASGFADVTAVVGDAFNVNESRAFSLAGGDINLWSSFGDIDAGRGAKTVVRTPETQFVIDPNNSAITFVRPASVSGSGIKTDRTDSVNTDELSDSERFDNYSTEAGTTYLATPLGIVDAGEAGIQSAGDLFIAAQEVRGADNISVTGVSVGVPVATSVSASIAGVGDAASSATNSAAESVAESISEAANSTTAFVTIELIDMGI